ncbi:DUF2752 domain-containing protein [Streptacidiphilus sp. ASG 303]|uniref:DUF2752 domain-containing protein n=1 Tax=Streptomycetaceae TaxID=2062 RepID=UPI001E58C500|nr:DUF2752 domain-containing protein [Streptacidiphilus sp. ASG 303]MCD0481579.1 DUF2752 domain-containing protein [Streptacidiphilus sp. ASG 303]
MNAPAAPTPRRPGPRRTGRPSAARRLAAPLAALVAVALPTLYVAAVDPNAPGRYPVCPFLQATGWWCPGCGGLRCVHALTHGHLTEALHDNLLAVLALSAAALLWLRWTAAAATGRPVRAPAPTRRHAVLLIAAAAAFTVVRNLPTGASLAP